MSLNEARVSFQTIGAKGPEHLAHVRPPRPHEVPTSN
jgi:hypothetical protein